MTFRNIFVALKRSLLSPKSVDASGGKLICNFDCLFCNDVKIICTQIIKQFQDNNRIWQQKAKLDFASSPPPSNTHACLAATGLSCSINYLAQHN